MEEAFCPSPSEKRWIMCMTKEQVFFIQVIRDHLNKDNTFIPDELNWDNIKKYAKQQQLEGIFYSQTKNPAFLSAFSSTAFYSSNRAVLLKNLLKEISTPYFIIKGSEVAQLYPVPALRTMGDTDIVVRDRASVHEVLLSQGYECRSKNDDREWQYYKMNMEFELHDRLVYNEAVNDGKQELFFNDFWKHVKDGKLDWNFHFMFLVFHLRKHFMNSGVGFRQFMDLAVVIKNTDMDWYWIEEKLREIELLPFFKVVLSFLKRWFDIEPPIDATEIENDFYEVATDKIFKDGIFGFDNEDNKEAFAINSSRGSGKFGQISLALKNVFPSYKEMKRTLQYSFIDGKPFLLPVAWIYRIFCGRKKMDAGIKAVKSSFVSAEEIEKRELMYKQWGL